MNLETLLQKANELDFWQGLCRKRRKILLYGMGNGADKLIGEAERRGVTVDGIFASDGFVRGHSFHGMRVMPYSEVRQSYKREDCVILLAFGSARPEVIELIGGVARDYDLFVPDLPVCGNQLFDADFLTHHADELRAARALFSDDASRDLFDAVLEAKLTARFDSLMLAVSEREPFDILKDSDRRITRMADLGAYTGDTAREALSHLALDFILAAEPDRRNFRKLCLWQESMPEGLVECHQVAIFDKNEICAFDASGNRNAGLCTGREGEGVPTASLDSLLDGRPIDYIKYDIEGAEREGLLGSAATIKESKPVLRVSLYHRPEDLFALPLLIEKLAPFYDFLLTRAKSLPAWDIDLLCLPRAK